MLLEFILGHFISMVETIVKKAFILKMLAYINCNTVQFNSTDMGMYYHIIE